MNENIPKQNVICFPTWCGRGIFQILSGVC